MLLTVPCSLHSYRPSCCITIQITDALALSFILFFCIDVYEVELNCCNERVRRWRQASGRSAKWLKSRGTQRRRQTATSRCCVVVYRSREVHAGVLLLWAVCGARRSGGETRYSEGVEHGFNQSKKRSCGGWQVALRALYVFCCVLSVKWWCQERSTSRLVTLSIGHCR